MSLITFDQMCAGIKRWCWDRKDLVGLIPDAIVLAESRMSDSLRVAQMEAETTITLTDGSGPLPDDYLAWRRLQLDRQSTAQSGISRSRSGLRHLSVRTPPICRASSPSSAPR